MRRRPDQECHTLTKGLRDRIRSKQKDQKLSDAVMGIAINRNKSVYKNIKNGANKTIDDETLTKIAEKLGCSKDYLLTGEDEDFQVPFHFIPDEYISDIASYLKKEQNWRTLQNLHLVLCELPTNHRDIYTKAFNQFITYIRKYSFIQHKTDISREKQVVTLNYLLASEILSEEDTVFSYYLDGLDYLKNNDIANAIHSLMEVIYAYCQDPSMYQTFSDSSIVYMIPLLKRLKNTRNKAYIRRLKSCSNTLLAVKNSDYYQLKKNTDLLSSIKRLLKDSKDLLKNPDDYS